MKDNTVDDDKSRPVQYIMLKKKPRQTAIESRNLTMNIELFENRFAKMREDVEIKLNDMVKIEKRGLQKCDIKEFYFELEN